MSDEKKNPAAVALGKLGGAAGTGKAKRRSPEHYARISRLGGSTPKKNGKKRRGDTRAGNARNRRTNKRAKKVARRAAQ